MSASVIARAPGKLFLLGEYAVLDGSPAIVAAIDRIVTVHVNSSATGARAEIRSDFGNIEFPCTAPPAECGPLRFALAAFRSAVQRLPDLTRQRLSITVKSALDDVTGVKLGFGGSAAVTVAVSAALFAAAGQPLTPQTRQRIFSSAWEAHRRVQGAGSGADVAASVYGGVLLFQPGEGLPQITPLPLPADAHLLVAWTGEPGSTPDLIERYREADYRPGCGDAGARAAFVRATEATVSDFVAALHQGTLSIAAVLANGDLLTRLAADLSLDLLTPRLQQAVDLARSEGAGAKISGAGGGDCAIALTQNAANAQRVRAAWDVAGLTPLEVNVSSQGVTSGFC